MCVICGERFHVVDRVAVPAGLSQLTCVDCRHADAVEIVARNRRAPWVVAHPEVVLAPDDVFLPGLRVLP
jgi:hypothetical protein